jgi:hypothetical protein
MSVVDDADFRIAEDARQCGRCDRRLAVDRDGRVCGLQLPPDDGGQSIGGIDKYGSQSCPFRCVLLVVGTIPTMA